MATILCGTLWFGQAGDFESPAGGPAAWKASPPAMNFIVGVADTYDYAQAIDNYDRDTTAVFPNRGWFRAAYLAGLNMATIGIGVSPMKERTEVSAVGGSSAVAGSCIVDFELRAYAPYVPSITGRGLAHEDGRDVSVHYTDTYDPAQDFITRIYEPALGGPSFANFMAWAPGARGGRDGYKPVAEALTDMGLVFAVSDYPDTKSLEDPSTFDPDQRAAQYREWLTTRLTGMLGYSPSKWVAGGHSGGTNTSSINLGVRHANVDDGTPEVLSTPLAGNASAPCQGAVYCSSQAVDGITTPYEDSFTFFDDTIPLLSITGEYDLDRKFHNTVSRRQLYDDSSGPAFLRFALWGFHQGGNFTGIGDSATQLPDWLIKDYYLSMIKAHCDWLFYGSTAGRDFILNNSYVPAQIISTHEERDIP